MKFLDKFQQYFEDSYTIAENIEENNKVNASPNYMSESATIEDHQILSDSMFLDLIEKLDNLFKEHSIKVKLKIYTSFGVEYILAKTYPNISTLINDNFQLNFVNRKNKNLFIIN